MIDFELLASVIRNNDNFVITTHVNPDGDAIGSEMGLYYVLKQQNKNVKIINHSATPYSLQFLDDQNVIEKYFPVTHDEIIKNADVIFFLDLNVLGRVVSMTEVCKASKAKKIVIDHHLDPEEFYDLAFTDKRVSATGEIIYDLIKKTNLAELNFEIAQALYASIMTDTGSFRYDRTTPKVHKIAAEFLSLGVDSEFVADQLFDKGSLGRLKLLGKALTSLSLNNNGQICSMVITKKDLEETKADESDIEGFVNYTLSINGVKIGLLFYELAEGFKISFRSKGNIPVNKLAAEFGGGGHLNAAGARFNGKKMNEYLPRVIERAEEYLK